MFVQIIFHWGGSTLEVSHAFIFCVLLICCNSFRQNSNVVLHTLLRKAQPTKN
jgi:hypothetical protein